MKITKYQHACLVIEKDLTTVVVDPGSMTHDLIIPRALTAIIITHDHADHLDEKLVGQILNQHPKATVYGHESVTSRFINFQTVTVRPGQAYQIGNMTATFFGGNHAAITAGMALPPNYGFMLDDFYYPGDSFTTPGQAIKILALPISAPWLKLSDCLEFLQAAAPAIAFPTHDAILSLEGKALIDRLVSAKANAIGCHYKRLDGLSLEI